MLKEKKIAGKKTRTQKIEDIADKRIAKVTSTVNADPIKKDADFQISRPENWDKMTASQKNTWDVDNKDQIIANKFSRNIDEIYKEYTPTKEKLPEINRDEIIDIERKIKNRKWLDIASGVLTGVQGKEVDRSKLPTGILKAERDKIFQDYKDIVQRNKATSAVWKNKEFESRINFLQTEHAKAKTPEEKALYEEEMAREKEQIRQFNIKSGQKDTSLDQEQQRIDASIQEEKDILAAKLSENQYTDKFTNETTGSKKLINEFAAVQGYALDSNGVAKPADQERISKIFIDKMYTSKKDEKTGELIFTPKPGMENYITDLSNKMNDAKTIEAELQSLSDKETTESAGLRDKKLKAVIDKYAPLKEQKKKELDEIKEHIKDTLEGRKNYTPTEIKKDKTVKPGDLVEGFSN